MASSAVGPGDAAGPAADHAPYYPNDFTPCRYDPAQLIADLEDAQAAARMNDDDKLTFLYAADAVSIAGAEERISRAGLSCGWTVTTPFPEMLWEATSVLACSVLRGLGGPRRCQLLQRDRAPERQEQQGGSRNPFEGDLPADPSQRPLPRYR
ncbi:MAG: hypothetical protein WAO15_08990 [Mycobacterium sp.]